MRMTIANIQNPVNILQQPKSSIITNPLIPNKQTDIEIEYEPVKVQTMPLQELHNNISNSCLGLLDDLLHKPSNVTWNTYIITSLQKDERYTYIAVLLILLALITFLLNR